MIITAWLYGTFNPLSFENVEDYHESKDALVIVEEDQYKTVTTKIFKQALLRYEVKRFR